MLPPNHTPTYHPSTHPPSPTTPAPTYHVQQYSSTFSMSTYSQQDTHPGTHPAVTPVLACIHPPTYPPPTPTHHPPTTHPPSYPPCAAVHKYVQQYTWQASTYRRIALGVASFLLAPYRIGGRATRPREGSFPRSAHAELGVIARYFGRDTEGLPCRAGVARPKCRGGSGGAREQPLFRGVCHILNMFKDLNDNAVKMLHHKDMFDVVGVLL